MATGKGCDSGRAYGAAEAAGPQRACGPSVRVRAQFVPVGDVGADGGVPLGVDFHARGAPVVDHEVGPVHLDVPDPVAGLVLHTLDGCHAVAAFVVPAADVLVDVEVVAVVVDEPGGWEHAAGDHRAGQFELGHVLAGIIPDAGALHADVVSAAVEGDVGVVLVGGVFPPVEDVVVDVGCQVMKALGQQRSALVAAADGDPDDGALGADGQRNVPGLVAGDGE